MRKVLHMQFDVATMKAYKPKAISAVCPGHQTSDEMVTNIALCALKQVLAKGGDLYVAHDGKTITIQHLVSEEPSAQNAIFNGGQDADVQS